MQKSNYTSRYLEIIGILRKNLVLKRIRELSRHKTETGFEKNELIKQLGISIRQSFEEIGPTFVKFGQLLSTRSDILQRQIIDELKKLQDRVKPFETQKVIEIIERQYNRRWTDIFLKIDDSPLAQGSIAQVHKAWLINGDKVAIKVQRPGIKEQIDTDLNILESIAKKANKLLSISQIINVIDVVSEFRSQLYEELDFEKEAYNLKRFKEINIDDEYVFTADVYEEFIDKKIIVMSFLDAKSIKSLESEDIKKYGEKISKRLIYSYTRQVFEHGYFHADPHPGNILIDDELNLYITDFGIVGTLSDRKKYTLLKLFMGISLNSTRIIIASLFELGALSSKVDTFKLERELQGFLDKYMQLSLSEVKIFNIFNEFLDLLYRYEIKIDRSLMILGKTVLILESLIEQLDSDSSFLELIKPIAKKLFRNFISFDYIKHYFVDASVDSFEILTTMPRTILDFARKFEENGYAIKLINEEDSKKVEFEERKLKLKVFTTFLIISLVTFLFSFFILSFFEQVKFRTLWEIITIFSGISSLVSIIIIIRNYIKKGKK